MRLTAFLTLLAFATPVLADEPPPPPYPPPGWTYQPRRVVYVEQRRWNLFELGCGIFGGAWVGTLYDTLNSNAISYSALIPIAGPFLAVDKSFGNGTNVFLMLDGLAQAAGITLVILGLSLTRKVPVYAVVPTANGVAIAGRW